MTPTEWRKHVKRLLKRRNKYQFGQPRATSWKVTNSGCTDTCIQHIVWQVHGKRVSLNKIRELSGAPNNQGLFPSQALRALRRLGLDYKVIDATSALQVAQIIKNRGPVIVAEMYWSHPQWQGYRYLGKTLNGTAVNNANRTVKVGLAKPLKKAGLTQWTFRSGHAVLGAWASEDMKTIGVRDPNHNSPGRPERPAWDEVTQGQLLRMMNSIKFVNGGRRLVYVPKEKVY